MDWTSSLTSPLKCLLQKSKGELKIGSLWRNKVNIYHDLCPYLFPYKVHQLKFVKQVLSTVIVGTHGWLRFVPLSITERGTKLYQPWVPTMTYGKTPVVWASIRLGMAIEVRGHLQIPNFRVHLFWVCLFVSLWFYVPLENFSLMSRRHYYRWSYDMCSALMTIARCHTYMGHPFVIRTSKDPWHSLLLPSVWHWSCPPVFTT